MRHGIEQKTLESLWRHQNRLGTEKWRCSLSPIVPKKNHRWPMPKVINKRRHSLVKTRVCTRLALDCDAAEAPSSGGQGRGARAPLLLANWRRHGRGMHWGGRCKMESDTQYFCAPPPSSVHLLWLILRGCPVGRG